MVKATAVLIALTVLLLSVESKAQEAEGATVDAKLSEIGDVTIIADTAKLVTEAQKEMSDISKDVDEKKRARDFKTIRLLRLRLNKRSLELRALLESFRQYKLLWRLNYSKNRTPFSPVPLINCRPTYSASSRND
jgi:hypothetical protein